MDGEDSVVILGEQSFQNALLRDFLERELPCNCHLVPEAAFASLGGTPKLILLDCDARPDPVPAVQRIQQVFPRAHLALINCDAKGFDHAVLYQPVLIGLVDRSVSPAQLIKAIRAMLRGGLWLPRYLLECLLLSNRQRFVVPEVSASLTKRELTVLRLLGNGLTNDQISNSLNLSIHTVKTHIYKTFKKLGISNRVEAANRIREMTH